MITTRLPRFDHPAIGSVLDELTPAERDELDFGVIGFDDQTLVQAYNTFESQAAGLRASSVIGFPLFTVVAPCMNNALVARRFEHAVATASALDVVVPYVLTLRMRPVRVALRLTAGPTARLRYVLVQRNA